MRFQPMPFPKQNPCLQACEHLHWASARALPTRSGLLGRAVCWHAAPVAAPESRDALLASGGTGGDPNRTGPHSPKLLARPVRPKDNENGNSVHSTTKTSSRSGGGGGGGGRGSGGRRPGGVAERTMASLAAYTGVVGTTALVLGQLAGLDLWGEFEWTSVKDLQMAAVVSLPLQLLNAALLMPSYSPAKQLPDLDSLAALEASLASKQQRREEAAVAAAPEPPTASTVAAAAEDAGAVAAATPTVAGLMSAAESSPPTTPAPPPSAAASQALSTASAPQPTPPVTAAAAAPSAGPASSPAAPSSARRLGPRISGGLVPADLWGRSRGGAGASQQQPLAAPAAAEDGWTALRGALHLAQGYYVSNNPTARLTPVAEAAYTLLDTAAGEMLYRGVLLTWLASWLQDRVYEAGVDEVLSYQLPAAAAALGLPLRVRDAVTTLGMYGACECAIAAAVAAFVVWSVLNRSRKAAKRLEAIMSVASSSSSSASAASSPPSLGRAQDATGDSSGAGLTGGAKGPAAADGSGGAQVLLGPGAPLLGASNAARVMRRAAAIQAARDALQILVLNGVFIASGGNLAASYTAAMVNQLLISAMQRHGARRMRERSLELARELKTYNAQMQRIANKYRGKLPKTATSRLDELTSVENSHPLPADGATSTATTSSNSTSSVEAAPSSSGSREPPPALSPSAFTDATGDNGSSSSSRGSNTTISSSSSSRIAPVVVPGSAAAATGTNPVGPAVASTVDGLAAGSSNNGNVSNGNSSSSSTLVRALAMLDRLVPEPPAKPATANNKPVPPPSQQQQ